MLNNRKVTEQAVIDAIESSLRVMAGLQQKTQPTPEELKTAIDELRMARNILKRGERV